MLNLVNLFLTKKYAIISVNVTETMTVPAGVSVAVCTPEMHRNPKYWKDPLTFDPDRFSPEKVAERDPFCYIPFNSGPRNCIGKKVTRKYRTAAIILCFIRLSIRIEVNENYIDKYNKNVQTKKCQV